MKSDIIKAIQSYIRRDNAPYAIMINGAWGIGKTHFIKNEVFALGGIGRTAYLSLYGLKSIERMEAVIHSRLQGQQLSSQPESRVRPLKRVTGSASEISDSVLSDNFHDQPHAAESTVLFIDDLERWSGDFDQCLSLINQLVEQDNYKCILIGNLDEFPKKGARAFSDAREKTIRHVYQFDNSYDSIFQIALTLPDYGSQVSERFMRTLVKNNTVVLERLLARVSIKNIRTVSEAFQLYEYVFQRNSKAFRSNKNLAFAYMMALLSALILVNKYLIRKEDRHHLLDQDHREGKGFKYLSEIGYFRDQASGGLSDEARYLLDTIFYRLDRISLKGLFSIVKNGFYVKTDFEGDFDSWKKELKYDSYLDKDKFYRFEDDEAQAIFTDVYRSLVDEKTIDNPITILLLAERIIEDMDDGVIELNPIEFKSQIIDTVDHLYENGLMHSVEISIFDLSGDRFSNCRAIYNHILRRSQTYQKVVQEQKARQFWDRLAESPAECEALLREFDPVTVFVYSKRPGYMLHCLTEMSNAQLSRFIHWFESDIGEGPDVGNAQFPPLMVVHSLIEAIVSKYGSVVGTRAAHLRRLAEVLKLHFVAGENGDPSTRSED